MWLPCLPEFEVTPNMSIQHNQIGISGIGVLSAHGAGVSIHREVLKKLKKPSTYRISDFKANNHIQRRYLRPLDQVTVQCIAMVADSIKDADINIESLDLARVGIVVGSMYAGIGSIFDFKKACYDSRTEDYLGLSPLYFPGIVFNSLSGQPAIEFGFTGINSIVNSGFSSGLLAVIKGAEYILSDQADIVIAGGAEMVHPFLTEKYSVRSADARLTKQGKEFKLSEAVCFFVLHRVDDQRFSKKNRYATLENWSYGFLGSGLVGDRLEKKIKRLVRGADELPETVVICTDESVLSHTHETEAIYQVFKASKPKVLGNKKVFGQTLGASGSLNFLQGLLTSDTSTNGTGYTLVNSLDPAGNFALLTFTQEKHRG